MVETKDDNHIRREKFHGGTFHAIVLTASQYKKS